MVSGLDVPCIFLSFGSVFPVSPSLHGVPLGWFPRFIGTMRDSDSSRLIRRRFLSFAPPYPSDAPVFAPVAAERAPRRPGVLLPEHRRLLRGKTRGLPGSWATRSCTCPVLGPRCASVPGHSAPRYCLPLPHERRPATTITLSGQTSEARALAVYASQPRSRTSTQNSLPAGGQPWPGRIGYLLGRFVRFPVDLRYLLSSSPRLLLAQWGQCGQRDREAGSIGSCALSERCPSAGG
jgi:hypothetical protein